jgi:long-subunit fatty acid transport protein
MARFAAKCSLYQVSRAMALLAGGSVLSAQGIFAVPASDPAGIGRSGAGVAFGRSLEAAALNPALLVTLPGRGALLFAGGQEFQSAQDTLESNQKTLYSTDRNRTMPTFGAAWVMNKRFAIGLKADTPFLRHAVFGPETTTRFLGDEISIEARRVELQLAVALREDVSLGLGFGAARIDYASGASLRAPVPVDPSRPLGSGNPALGLVERQVRQDGDVTVPSVSFGLRWAISPRWTLGLAYQGALAGDLRLKASFGVRSPSYVATDGLSAPPLGISTPGSALLALSSPRTGSERIQLPSRATLGLRHRPSNIFTWEADLRFVDGAKLELPGQVGLDTPSGPVASPAKPFMGQRSIGLSLMGELALGKDWTVRGGFSMDQGLREDSRVEPLMGGARTAGFSVGASYRLGRGELSLGYQVRQAQDVDSRALDGAWSIAGYRSTGTMSRVENSGHLYALGYKVSF